MNFTIDGNEWFMFLTSLAGFYIILRLRKHFHPVTLMIIWIFTISYVETIDYFLGATPFKAYYCADNFTYEPAAAIIHAFLYPCASFLFLYFYDKKKIRGKWLAGYYVLWTVISLLFEWINIWARVFTYTGWTIIFSIPTYPLSAFILIKLFNCCEKHLNPSPDPKHSASPN
jgi:hypothetical protein